MRTLGAGHPQQPFPPRHCACAPGRRPRARRAGRSGIEGAMSAPHLLGNPLNTPGRPACAQQGFTLIEVLVALVLLALLSLIAWRGLDAVQHASARVDAQAEETLALLRAWGQLERDLNRHAGQDVLPVWQAADGGIGPAGLATPAPGIAWTRESGLYLVRATDDGRWQRVHWYASQGALYRAAGAPAIRLPLP